MTSEFLPDGLDAILRQYGNPFAFADHQALWEQRTLDSIPVPSAVFRYLGQPIAIMRVHRIATMPFRKALVELVHQGLTELPYGGCYRWTDVGGQLTIHAWGVALDIGPVDQDTDSKVAAVMAAYGFARGDEQTPALPGHFQLATGYWVE